MLVTKDQPYVPQAKPNMPEPDNGFDYSENAEEQIDTSDSNKNSHDNFAAANANESTSGIFTNQDFDSKSRSFDLLRSFYKRKKRSIETKDQTKMEVVEFTYHLTNYYANNLYNSCK